MNDDLTFTGERLHQADPLFGIDLARHRTAYQEAIRLASEHGAQHILELGSGTGYGTEELAAALPHVIAIDRVAPLTSAGRSHPGHAAHSTHDVQNAHYVRGDLTAIPLSGRPFDLIVSFQVIEHLSDPSPYLDALAKHLAPGGIALVSTPNAAFSDGENPFHVREYEAPELKALLETRFAQVEVLGVSARGEALNYHRERLRRIRRIILLDPFGLRHRIPRPLVEWLFAKFAVLVRRGIAGEAGLPSVDLNDFPIERAHPESLDLFAVCRAPNSN